MDGIMKLSASTIVYSMFCKSLAQNCTKSRPWLVTLATRVNKQYLARDVMRPADPPLLPNWDMSSSPAECLVT